MKQRFSKAMLLERLRVRAENRLKCHGWDPNNGTAQLWPRGCDEATKNLIDRAVQYGEWHNIRSMINELKSGE